MPLLTALSRVAAPGRWAGLLLIGPLLLGADDHYLGEIEAEVQRQAAMLIPAPAAPELGPTVTDANDRIAAGLDQPGFEQALRTQLPGTYAFYQQLSPSNQQKVYATYQQDNRLTAISQQIVRLTSGKP